MTPEEEDEEAAYDRADDLVRPDLEARGNVEVLARTTTAHAVYVLKLENVDIVVLLHQNNVLDALEYEEFISGCIKCVVGVKLS